jgi:hypothetical protein
VPQHGEQRVVRGLLGDVVEIAPEVGVRSPSPVGLEPGGTE